MNEQKKLGVVCLLGWCIFSALARVLTSNVSQHISVSVLCFYSFLIASAIFCCLNFKNRLITVRKVFDRSNLFAIVWLNLNTFGAWFFLIYPLKFIQPGMVSSITMGFGPMATLLISFFIGKKITMNFFDMSIASLLTVIIFFIIGLCITHIATIGIVSWLTLAYAIVSCFIVGFSTAAGNLYAKQLSNNNFSPTEILSSRFFFTVIMAGSIALINGETLLLSTSDLYHVVIVAGCLVILPLYLAQMSINYLELMVIAIIAPLMPTLVLFFQLLNHQHVSHWEISVAILIFLLMSFSVYVRLKENKKLIA